MPDRARDRRLSEALEADALAYFHAKNRTLVIDPATLPVPMPQPDHSESEFKAKFFKEILEQQRAGKLSVDWLTQKLAELSEQNPVAHEKRKKLFYRKNWFTKRTNSKAAKLIKALYADMGVQLSKQRLNAIVSGTMNAVASSTSDETHTEKLQRAQYTHWQARPYSNSARFHLEYEIKCRVGLGNVHTNEMDLVAAFNHWANGKDANEHALKLLDIYQEGEDFFPDFGRDLVRDTSTNHTTADPIRIAQIKDERLRDILRVCFPFTGDEDALDNPYRGTPKDIEDFDAMRRGLLNADKKIALLAVQQEPQLFFELTPELQKAVHQTLLCSSDSGATLTAITGLVQQSEGLRDKQLALLENPEDARVANAPGDDLDTLSTTIANNIRASATEVMQAEIKEKALTLIEAYLDRSRRGTIKRQFFKDLKRTLEGYTDRFTGAPVPEQALTIALLQRKLSDANRTALFNKTWGKSEDSNAAKTIFELYRLIQMNVSGKSELTPADKEQIVTTGFLPFEDGSATEIRTATLEDKINDILRYPGSAQGSKLGRHIAKEIDRLKNYTRFAQRQKALNVAKAEAIYQQFLIEKAFAYAAVEIAAPREADLRFDPQGHLLTEVTLAEVDYAELLRKFDEQGITLTGTDNDDEDDEPNKSNVESLLGLEDGMLTKTTYCSLDVRSHTTMKKEFKTNYATLPTGTTLRDMNEAGLAVPTPNLTTLKEALTLFLASNDRSSVIPLQQEMEMHMRLMSRVLENKLAANQIGGRSVIIDANQWRNIRRNAAIELSKYIRTVFQHALCDANVFDGTNIDYAELNKRLDEARPNLAKLARASLYRAFEGEYPAHQLDDDFDELHALLSDTDFSSTTATGCDYLHADARNQTCTRYSATDQTAHNKVEYNDEDDDEQQGLRVVRRNLYTITADNPSVTQLQGAPVESRIPSMAVKGLSDSGAIDDVKEKLDCNYKTLTQAAGDYRGPVYYDLHTSQTSAVTQSLLFTEHKNRQRESADRIIRGAHAFNTGQVEKGNIEQLFYVQNIGVNQHGLDLGYECVFGANNTSEATLMAEMSVLSTLNQNAHVSPPALRDEVQAAWNGVHEAYVHFLGYEYDNSSFKDSEEGREAIRMIRDFKRWGYRSTENLLADETSSLKELATKALTKLLVHNKHFDKQYGMLIQSLSVFLQPVSMNGCKSGNERTQAVMDRVELLRSLDVRRSSNNMESAYQCAMSEINQDESTTTTAVVPAENTYTTEEAQVFIELFKFANSNDFDAVFLQTALDTAYNRHTLYASAAAISHEDMGAASKLRASTNTTPGEIDEFSTNVGEPPEVTRLAASNTSAMQSHKFSFVKWLKSFFTSDHTTTHTPGLAR